MEIKTSLRLNLRNGWDFIQNPDSPEVILTENVYIVAIIIHMLGSVILTATTIRKRLQFGRISGELTDGINPDTSGYPKTDLLRQSRFILEKPF